MLPYGGMNNILKGKLTYIVSAITALWAVAGFFLGQLEAEQAGVLILAALGTYGIRRVL